MPEQIYVDNMSKAAQYTWIICVIQMKLGLDLNYLNNSLCRRLQAGVEQSKENGLLSYSQLLKHPTLLFPWQENLLGALPGGSPLEIEKKKETKGKKQPVAVFSENSLSLLLIIDCCPAMETPQPMVPKPPQHAGSL